MHYLLSIIIFIIGLLIVIPIGLNRYTEGQTAIIHAETTQKVRLIQAQAQANQALVKAEADSASEVWPYKLIAMSIVVLGIVTIVGLLVWWNVEDGRQVIYQVTHNHYTEQKLIVVAPGQSHRQMYKQLSNNQTVLLSTIKRRIL